MVSIGYAEDDPDKTIRPVAHAGFEEGYLETLRLTWADTERGRGPGGTAIRTARPWICRSMLVDPSFAPWREEARRRGYASSIVLPLLAEGRAFGERHLLGAARPLLGRQQRLLNQLAGDLAYGITVIRQRSALREAQRRLSVIVDSIADGFYALDRQWRFTHVNDAALRHFRMSREALLGPEASTCFPFSQARWRSTSGVRCRPGEPAHFDVRSAVVNATMETHAYPSSEGLTILFRDVTERHRMAAALTHALDEPSGWRASRRRTPVPSFECRRTGRSPTGTRPPGRCQVGRARGASPLRAGAPARRAGERCRRGRAGRRLAGRQGLLDPGNPARRRRLQRLRARRHGSSEGRGGAAAE